MVIVAAIIVGVLLMQYGLGGDDSDSDEDTTAAESDGTTEGSESTEGVADSTTTSTTVAVSLRPPNEVKVLVLNGAGIGGVAGRNTDRFKAANYRTANPGDTEPSASQVLYMDGYQAEAEDIATTFYEVDAATVVAAYSTIDPAPTENTEESNIVVIIGNDGVFGS